MYILFTFKKFGQFRFYFRPKIGRLPKFCFSFGFGLKNLFWSIPNHNAILTHQKLPVKLKKKMLRLFIITIISLIVIWLTFKTYNKYLFV